MAIFSVAVPSFNPLHEILLDCILADKLETKINEEYSDDEMDFNNIDDI